MNSGSQWANALVLHVILILSLKVEEGDLQIGDEVLISIEPVVLDLLVGIEGEIVIEIETGIVIVTGIVIENAAGIVVGIEQILVKCIMMMEQIVTFVIKELGAKKEEVTAKFQQFVTSLFCFPSKELAL